MVNIYNMLSIFSTSNPTVSTLFKYLLSGLIATSFFVQSAFAVAALPTTGEQKTLVLMVNFQENPSEQPLTSTEADSLVFGEVNDFYQQNSYGQSWLSGQVAGWFTLPLSNQVCDFASVQQEADESAIASGIALNEYDRIIYLMTNTACISEGLGTMEESPSRAYINGIFTARLIAHELGHNFGLHHSHALDCGEQTLSENCLSIEYGDTYDVMGKPDIGYFNTIQKEQLGWLNGQYSSSIINAAQDGIYTISNYETQTYEQPSTIKIPRGVDPVTGLDSWFYIEYRQAQGFDSFLSDRSYRYFRGDVTDGVIVRVATEGDANSSHLLHLKTDSQYREVYGRNDWYDPAMPVGGSYTDPVSGVTLSLISAANGIAEVNVSFSSPVCTTNSPSLFAETLTPSSVNAGEQVQYLLTITNNNSVSCNNAAYNISAVLADAWQANNEQISLSSGESGQVVVSVTSPAEATTGAYTIPMIAENIEQADSSSMASVSYTITEQEVSTLTAADDIVILTAIEATTIDVLMNDSMTSPESVTLIDFSQSSKGSVEQLSDGTLLYVPGRRFKNNDSFSYTISDGFSTSTALVTITLEESTSDSEPKPSGKGKKK